MPWTDRAAKNIAGALAQALKAEADGDDEGAAAARNQARQIMDNPASKTDGK